MRLTRTLLALGLFGIAFGYVEAAVVVYLRTIYGPIRQATFPTMPHGDLLPRRATPFLNQIARALARIMVVVIPRP
jgi:hypothetical protein